MSRFDNLELGGESEEQSPAPQKALVKGETYYLNEARTAFENGNFEHALRFYSKVLEYNPNNAAAWTAQVRMLIELGEFREATAIAQQPLECGELPVAARRIEKGFWPGEDGSHARTIMTRVPKLAACHSIDATHVAVFSTGPR